MTEATILVTVDTVSVSCNVPNFKDTYILTNLKIMSVKYLKYVFAIF